MLGLTPFHRFSHRSFVSHKREEEAKLPATSLSVKKKKKRSSLQFSQQVSGEKDALKGLCVKDCEKYMAFSHGRDFLFCDICGTLLSLGSREHAECPLCGFKRDVKEIEGRATSYTITAEDIRRELNIEPFVQLDKISVEEVGVQRAVVNEACPQCRNPQLEYYTKQLRSADEGQTVFYECPKCKHKFSVNT